MIETCTQCKQKAEIQPNKWVCAWCESKAVEINEMMNQWGDQ
jgi:Zn finger protein HypA/HybF involved in hydrogenase expression